MHALPLIDVAALGRGDTAERRAITEALRLACSDSGFFYVVGHGVSEAALAAVLAQARALFALPDAAKGAVARTGVAGTSGYAAMSGRTIDGDAVPAAKEEYYLSADADANPWPAELPAGRSVLADHFAAMMDLAQRLVGGLALSLDLAEDHFATFCTDPIASLRLVRYAPDAAGAAAHTDYGALTLLLQDATGGLEVLDRGSGVWIAAPPLPGAIVVNIGDLFERWTNGRYRSSTHRVVNVARVERFSAPFFLSGAADHPVECLPSCLGAGERPLFRPTTVAGHLAERFAAQRQ
jgi:isopenicillin N synthase-like dioxygenase